MDNHANVQVRTKCNSNMSDDANSNNKFQEIM